MRVSRPSSQSPESGDGQTGESQEGADQGKPDDHSAACFVLCLHQGQVSTSRTVFLLSITHAAKFRSSLERLHRAAVGLRVFIHSGSVLLI